MTSDTKISDAEGDQPRPADRAGGGHPSRGERPSAHGAALGRFLNAMVDAGGGAQMCATCAFREGSMPNRMAGTGMVAMKCATGLDPDPFACHHGMNEGQPTRLCAGYLAARKAPFDLWQAGLAQVLDTSRSFDEANDQVRADFDAWWPTVDPDTSMDVYQLGRAYARRDGIAQSQPDPTP